MKVLLVEDEPQIASFVEKGLTEAGFSIRVERDGDAGYAAATGESFDALVLDIMLPGRDGLSILKRLREQNHAVPIVMLTARGELDEKLEGLELGADDYLTKPFFVEELIARIHAVARRSTRDQLSVIEVGSLSVNFLTREVRCGETAVELTAREFALLEYLVRRANRVLTRTQILEHVWNYDFDPGTNVVDVYVRRVRRKIGDCGTIIQTVRGVGYKVVES